MPLFDYLSEMLQHKDKNIRRAAAYAIGDMGEAAAQPEILDRLVSLLQDEDRGVRRAAADEISSMGEAAAQPEILDRLVSLLQDEDRGARRAAAEIFKKFSAQGIRIFKISMKNFGFRAVKQLSRLDNDSIQKDGVL